MKTLPEILRDAKILLDTSDRVVIARGEHTPTDGRSCAYRIRLRHDVEMVGLSAYRCETSGWLGEAWSSWTERRGWLGGASFDIDDVLATDWRIAS